MFKAEIEWRGLEDYHRVSGPDGYSPYNFIDANGVETRYMPAIVSIESFCPIKGRKNVDLGTTVKKGLLGEKEKPLIVKSDVLTAKTQLYVHAPFSYSPHQNTPSPLKYFEVDVPYQAMKQLSVIAERTGAIIDLTTQGQSKIREAFANKTGVFANVPQQNIMLDVDKSVEEQAVAQETVASMPAPKTIK